MSLTSRGSVGRRPSGLRRAKCTSGIQGDTEHDLYVAYCEEDKEDVQTILDVLKQQKLDIYDPHEDAPPHATLFKAWLEEGIYKSKITIIFLTKNFVRHNYCRFQAEHAVLRYTRTKGSHRVMIVMLQSCKIPKSLHHFNCVYAWKFREAPLEQCIRILKAIFAPRDKFRRGSILCCGLSARALQIAKETVGDIRVYKESKKRGNSLLKYRHLFFNLSRIKFVLENCELKCTSENCGFKCSGDKIINQFFEHVKVCKYQKVKCRYCRQTTLLKNQQRHEQTTCKRRRVLCPNESCGQKLTKSEMYKHERVCSYKECACPNYTYGCRGVFARKDKAKHLEICAYEKVKCERCNNYFFQVDFKTHKNEIPRLKRDPYESFMTRENDAYKCYFNGCTYTGLKSDLEYHQLSCEFRTEQCADCGMRFPLRELVWHRRQCDRIIECELCRQLVPSSSKLTHDRWICNGQNIRELCEVCHTCVSSGRKENHLSSCVRDNPDYQTGGTATGSAGGLIHQLPIQTNQSRTLPEVGISANSAGGGQKPGPLKTPTKKTSPSFEQILCDTLPIPIPRTEHSIPDDNSTSSSPHVSPQHLWSPSKRDIWRCLMDKIDRDGSGFRKTLSYKY